MEPQVLPLPIPSPEGAQVRGLRELAPSRDWQSPGAVLPWDWHVHSWVGVAWLAGTQQLWAVLCGDCEVSCAAITNALPVPLSPCGCRSVSSVSGKTSHTCLHRRRHFQHPQGARSLGCHQAGRGSSPSVPTRCGSPASGTKGRCGGPTLLLPPLAGR